MREKATFPPALLPPDIRKKLIANRWKEILGGLPSVGTQNLGTEVREMRQGAYTARQNNFT